MAGRARFLSDLDPLLAALSSWGRVIGPVIRDGALVLGDVSACSDLPRGWEDEQEAGRYRLSQSGSTWFGHTLVPGSFKRYLYPPRLTLWRARRDAPAPEPVEEAIEPFALLGLRGCDVAAIEVLDRVLLQGEHVDGDYRRRREAALLVAVACARSAPTCFCVSAGGGPRPRRGFDLLLTELENGFLLEAGSPRGEEVARRLEDRPASEEQLAEAAAAEARAARQQRALPPDAGRRLKESWESPRWAAVAERCLACGNCTLVCPTCFCVAAEQSVDLAGEAEVRSRRWDSCFTPGHSHLHGGAVHASTASRYRQWLTHKLSTWEDQFGVPGCTGCGRCITWCPAAIDLVKEAAALVAPTAQGGGS